MKGSIVSHYLMLLHLPEHVERQNKQFRFCKESLVDPVASGQLTKRRYVRAVGAVGVEKQMKYDPKSRKYI